MKVEKPRLQFLESIRGLAALAVVFYHLMLGFWPYMEHPYPPPPPHVRKLFLIWSHSPLSFLYHGSFAVIIFFVLSGFVLTYSFFRSPSHERVSESALRRYFRLALPVTISVLIAYALMQLHAFHNDQAALLNHSEWLGPWYRFQSSFWANDSSGALRQGLYGSFFYTETGYNNVIWTMGIELRGSMLVYAFLALFGRLRNRWILYVAACVALFSAGDVSGGFYLDFLIGVMLCDFYVHIEMRDRLFDLGHVAWLLVAAGCWCGGVPLRRHDAAGVRHADDVADDNGGRRPSGRRAPVLVVAAPGAGCPTRGLARADLLRALSHAHAGDAFAGLGGLRAPATGVAHRQRRGRPGDRDDHDRRQPVHRLDHVLHRGPAVDRFEPLARAMDFPARCCRA